jgi:hypothetical protein
MKESYRENLASCSGLEPYAGEGNLAGVASVRGNAGQPLSSALLAVDGARFRVPILSCQGEGNIVPAAIWRGRNGRGGVRDPVHASTS